MTPKEFERLDREERIAALKYVVLLIALRRRDHPFRCLIEGWHPQNSSPRSLEYPLANPFRK